MPDARERRERIETLLRESEELEDGLAQWQRDSMPSASQIREAQRMARIGSEPISPPWTLN